VPSHFFCLLNVAAIVVASGIVGCIIVGNTRVRIRVGVRIRIDVLVCGVSLIERLGVGFIWIGFLVIINDLGVLYRPFTATKKTSGGCDRTRKRAGIVAEEVLNPLKQHGAPGDTCRST